MTHRASVSAGGVLTGTNGLTPQRPQRRRGRRLSPGIERAGANSAFVRSVGYEGFQSASVHGKGGFMIFSGSVLPNSPDNYTGAGIEIHDGVAGDGESFLKFRTIDSDNDFSSSFEVKTSRFFLIQAEFFFP